MTLPLASPCSGVCRIDAVSSLCVGCRRTLDEIARWQTMGDAGRRAVWQRLASHRADPARTELPKGAGGTDNVDEAADGAAGPSDTPRPWRGAR